MLKKKEYRNKGFGWLGNGLHQKLAKLKIMKGANPVGADDYVDERSAAAGHLVVYDFRKSRLLNDQAESAPDDIVIDDADNAGMAEVHQNMPVDAKIAEGRVVRKVLNKAIDDSAFWVDLLENSSAALSEFKLSSEAKAAISSGDVQWVYANVDDVQEGEMTFLYKRLERSI